MRQMRRVQRKEYAIRDAKTGRITQLDAHTEADARDELLWAYGPGTYNLIQITWERVDVDETKVTIE